MDAHAVTRRMGTLLAATAAIVVAGCTHAEAPRAEAKPAPMAAPEVKDALAEATAHPTHDNGVKVAAAIMAQWQRMHPESDWVAEQHARHVIKPPADNAGLVGRGQGATSGQITAADVATWDRETRKLVAMGSKIFHSADELGSTVAVSCDMCHPDAANTHPETYPKFQVQLGRVALLRDMINWCAEQPVRGPGLDPDGARMRALEAYILAQRQGTPLDYGRR